jgi:hypothetical protein
MNDQALAMINLVYFSANFPHDFIYKVWEGNLAVHFSNKMEGIVSRNKSGHCDYNCFFRFFLELTTDNQQLLCDWIVKNYSHNK